MTVSFILISGVLFLTPILRGGALSWVQCLICLGALWAFAGLVLCRGFKGQRVDLPRMTLFLPFLAFLTLCLFSAWHSKFSALSFSACVMLIGYAMIFWTTYAMVETRRQARVLCQIIIAGAVTVAIIAFLRRVGMQLPGWIFADFSRESALTGTYANHNHFSGLMEMAVPLTLGLILSRGKSREKSLMLWSVLALLVLSLALTLSRGGWLSVMGGLCVMAWAGATRFPRYRSRIRLILIPVAGLLALALIQPSVSGAMGTLAWDTPGDYLAFRHALWMRTLDMIRDHLSLGTGPGTYARTVIYYNPAGFDVLPVHAHNDFLQFTAETGILFIPLALWLGAAFFTWSLAPAEPGTHRSRGITLGCIGAVTAILLHSLVDFNLHIPANALTFTVLAALALSSCRPAQSPKAKKAWGRTLALGLPVTAICLAISVCLGFLLEAGFWFDRAEVFSRTRDYPAAVSSYNRAFRLVAGQAIAGRLPEVLAGPCLAGIHTGLARAWYKSAAGLKDPVQIHERLRRAMVSLDAALKMDAESYEANAWAGRTLDWMDQLEAENGLVRPISGDPLPFLRKAASLRPTGAAIHYDLLRCLVRRQGPDHPMAGQICETIARIFPAAASKILAEPFAGSESAESGLLAPGLSQSGPEKPESAEPGIVKRVRQGLEAALADGTTPRTVLLELSYLEAGQGRLTLAISYYKRAMDHQAMANTTVNYIHLGSLYLKTGDFSAAGSAFEKGLALSDRFSADLERIFDCFGREKAFAAFLTFLDHLEQALYPSARMQTLRASCLIEMGNSKEAFELLNRMKTPDAGGFHLMARIAADRKDWSTAAALEKKALQYAPDKHRYWIALAEAQEHLGQMDAALSSSGRAVDSSTSEQGWVYRHRAGIYLKLGDTESAIKDLEVSLSYEPDDPLTLYLLARAQMAAGRPQLAKAIVDKGLTLYPFRAELLKLKARLSAP